MTVLLLCLILTYFKRDFSFYVFYVNLKAEANFDAKSNLQLLIVLLLKVHTCSLKWDACKQNFTQQRRHISKWKNISLNNIQNVWYKSTLLNKTLFHVLRHDAMTNITLEICFNWVSFLAVRLLHARQLTVQITMKVLSLVHVKVYIRFSFLIKNKFIFQLTVSLVRIEDVLNNCLLHQVLITF